MIKSVPGNERFFLAVTGSCDVDIRLINNNVISQCKVVKKERNKYVLMSIPFVENLPFLDFFSELSEKDTLPAFKDSFEHLLQAISKLADKEIVHFDLKADNIIYNTKIGKPQIIDFGISMPIGKDKFDKKLHKYFYVYAPEYYVWPLEVHMICYFLHGSAPGGGDALSKTDAHLVAEEFVEHHKVLSFLSTKERKQYLSDCLKVVETYVGMSQEQMVDKVKSSYKTWDNYAISVVYFKLFVELFPREELDYDRGNNSVFVDQFVRLLLVNMNPYPSKRLSIAETQKQLGNIFGSINGSDTPLPQKISSQDILVINEELETLNTFNERGSN